MVPSLALVPGEPAGIGPELCIRLAQQLRSDAQLVAYADPDTLNLSLIHISSPSRPASALLTRPMQRPSLPACLPLLATVLPADGKAS